MNLDSVAGRAVIEAVASLRVPCRDRNTVSDDEWLDLLTEAALTLDVALAVRVPCETCGGSGWVPAAPGSSYITTATGDPCDECDGSGSVPALRLLMEDKS